MVCVRAIEITLTDKRTAKSGAEWSEYHHDTYDFVPLVTREDSMVLLVVPAKGTSLRSLAAMLTEDLVTHRFVTRRTGRVA